MSDAQRILFLCTANSCRSQMAEGFARALRGDAMRAWSAGTMPGGVNPLAIRAMAEVGVDISAHESKTIDDAERAAGGFDLVITVCDHASEACPVFPGKTRVLHVGFEDPPALAADAVDEDDAMPHYRRVRDEIRQFVLTIDTLRKEDP